MCRLVAAVVGVCAFAAAPAGAATVGVYDGPDLSAVALAFLPHLAPAPAYQGARSGGVEGMAPLSRGRSKIAHEIPPQQRTAGLVYSVPEADFVVEPFELSDWWPRAYAMAVGRNRTAVLCGARDPEQDVIYLYSEHSLGRT